MQRIARLSIVLALGGVLVACGGDGGSAKPDGGGADSGSSSGCSLVGTWATTLGTKLNGTAITGTTTFGADGKLSAVFPVAGIDATATQDYAVSGSQLTLTKSGGTLACMEPDVVPTTGPKAGQSIPDVGIYSVAFADDCKSFTLTLVSDPCSVENLGGMMHRAEDLNGSSYSKQ